MSALRKFFSAFKRDEESEFPEDIPPVVVFDSDANGPRDLDDPFQENHIQARVGDVIAKTGQKK